MLYYLILWFVLFLVHHGFVVTFAGSRGFSLGGFASLLLADAAAAGLFGSVLMLIRRLRGKLSAFITVLIYVLLATFLVVAFGFAKLYERPFALSFVRLDTASIWRENFVSGLYELGWPHLLLLAITVLILFGQHRLMPLWNRRIIGLFFVSLVALPLIFFASPREFSVVSNPLLAAFQRRTETIALAAAAVDENDLIPSLESPEPAPFLRPVKVQRRAGRNIILYYLESTPFSAIGKKINGREVTPNLNRFSEKSLFFRRHYANFPLSINAFYNSFCSSYALPDGAWISLALPDFMVPCLSQVLGDQGYRSAALHAGYLGYAKQKRFMQRRGFRLMMDAETIKKPPFEKGMGPWGAADERAMIRPLSEFASSDTTSPFLALLFAFAPHHPYNMPDEFPEFTQGESGMKKSQVRFFNSLHYADTAFGEILAALEKRGVLKNTILIVFGDHGEAFYEHPGNYNHPFYLYEENIHVPLMIWYDGVEAQSVDRVTSHVDILPTILDLLGQEKLQSPLHVGKSMLRAGPQSLAHIQAYWQEEYSGTIDARYKYIRKENGSEEFYDLIADAAEQKNLIGSPSAGAYRALTGKAFQQKKLYYKKFGNYELTRFNPASQDK